LSTTNDAAASSLDTTGSPSLPEYAANCTNVACNHLSDLNAPVSARPGITEISRITCVCRRTPFLITHLEQQLANAKAIKHTPYIKHLEQLLKETSNIPIFYEKKNYYQLTEFYNKCQKVLKDWEENYAVAGPLYNRMQRKIPSEPGAKVIDKLTDSDRNTFLRAYAACQWIPSSNLVRLAEKIAANAPAPPPPRPPRPDFVPNIIAAPEAASMFSRGYVSDSEDFYKNVKTAVTELGMDLLIQPTESFRGSRDLGFGGYVNMQMPNFVHAEDALMWLEDHPAVYEKLKDEDPLRLITLYEEAAEAQIQAGKVFREEYLESIANLENHVAEKIELVKQQYSEPVTEPPATETESEKEAREAKEEENFLEELEYHGGEEFLSAYHTLVAARDKLRMFRQIDESKPKETFATTTIAPTEDGEATQPPRIQTS
jgi:hypothetical protein